MEATESSRILPSKQDPKVLSYKVGKARQMGRQAAQGGVQGSGAISFFFFFLVEQFLRDFIGSSCVPRVCIQVLW